MKSRRNIKWLWRGLFLALVLSWQADAQIIINEVSASNTSTIYDEDGDAPDWIELLNTSDTPVLLSDYYISDKPDDLFLYRLPEIMLQPGNFTVLFASDKDRPGGQLFWETTIRENDATKYLIPSSPVSDQWIQNDFNDSSWLNGSFGIGYGDGDDVTIVPNGTISVFTRTTFTIDDLSTVEKILMHIDFDDAFVAYINGVEVHRENISGDTPVAYNVESNNYTEPRLVFNETLPSIDLDNFISALVEGENTLAIQVHNYNSNSSDITLIPFLSIGYTQEPENTRGVAPETGLSAQISNNAHTNFKLSADGETIYLSDVSPIIIDTLTYPKLKADESFGRSAIDNELYIFTITTPGRQNNIGGYTTRSENPVLSKQGGFFENQVSIVLTNQDIGDITYFTEDGRIPTKSDEVFGSGNRVFDSSKILKFRTFEPGGIPSDVVVESYFINENHDLPVVTVSTHPDNLWSDENGIYVVGTNGITGFGRYEDGGANWNQDWEIPVHFELFNKDGTKSFGVGAGAKIGGAWSRNNPAKSLNIFFRSEYGTRALDHKVFESKEIYSFQSLTLRNSGNDFTSQGHSMFRDGLMTTLLEGTENDFQAFQPAVLYLNGDYWGIHNIREKINEHFIESNSNADSDNIDLLQGGGEMDFPNGFGATHGTTENYDELIEFIVNSDLRNAGLYAQVEEQIDINNYIDYMAAQIYYANTDWPGNNIKMWRSRESGGKWRWIIYDTDFGFGLSYGGQYWHNTLQFALEPNGSGWPNPQWSTLLFRELFESDIFKAKFANRMADLMNTKFKPSYVHSVIDSLSGMIESEIPRHMNTSTRSGSFGGSVNGWYSQIQTLKDYANQRPNVIENNFTQSIGSGGKLGVGSLQNTTVTVSNLLHGKIKVNRLLIDEASWTGRYFGGVDIPVTAIPKAGFEFSRWTGDVESTDLSINIRAGDNVVATFVPSSNQADIVINEIMYNADATQESDDWIELYNPGSSSVNLAGWVLKDEDDDHAFILPEGAVLNPNGYLVLAKDRAEFEAIYPEMNNLIGDIGFGFSGNSDEVRLFNPDGELVDSVLYDDETPWPTEADGIGYSLELIDASTDNSIASNWRASSHYLGSPGLENGQSVSINGDSEVPAEIELLQNYPNPFNPSTTISFSIPKASNVRINIYSVSGQLVATLIDEFVQTGRYRVRWDASNQASGVYFYTLNVGEERFLKKMVLIK
jgi:hypothetical protein